MTDCVFCSIASGSIPATLVHSDDHVVAFRDLNPQAPTHVLVIPRAHIASAAELTNGGSEIAGQLLVACATIAAELGLSDGWRAVTNVGSDGGQTVEHLHLHLLGGRAMTWPPG